MAVALDSLISKKGSPPNYGLRRIVSAIGLACIVGMDSLVPDVDMVRIHSGSGLGYSSTVLNGI